MRTFFDDSDDLQNEADRELGGQVVDKGLEKGLDKLQERAAERKLAAGARKAGQAGRGAGAVERGAASGAEKTAVAATERAAVQAGERAALEGAAPETFGLTALILAALEVIRRLPVVGPVLGAAESAVGVILKVAIWPIAGFCISCCAPVCSCCLAIIGAIAAVIGLLVFGVMNLFNASGPPGFPGDPLPPGQVVVTKTATPNAIPACASGSANDITYNISVTNNGTTPVILRSINDIFVDDPGFSPPFYYNIEILPGETWNMPPFDYNVPDTCDERLVINNVIAQMELDGGVAQEFGASAFVRVGNPTTGPPIGCPIRGTITTPYGINIPGYGYFGGRHDGIDISDTAGSALGSPVHSTLTGNAVASVGNAGNQIVTVTSLDGMWQVKFLHLAVGSSVSGPVTVGQIIGIEHNTGIGTGTHLHYEVYQNVGGSFVLQSPFRFVSASLNFTEPSGNPPNYSIFGGVVPTGGWGYCNSLPPGS